MKKDQHLENQKCYRDPSNIFDFPKVHLFSSRGFFTFLATVVHGAAWHAAFCAACGARVAMRFLFCIMVGGKTRIET